MDKEMEKCYIREMREQQILQAADWMIELDLSVREIADAMTLSYSKVYNYLRYELKDYDPEMHAKCELILKKHRWNRSGKNTLDTISETMV